MTTKNNNTFYYYHKPKPNHETILCHKCKKNYSLYLNLVCKTCWETIDVDKLILEAFDYIQTHKKYTTILTTVGCPRNYPQEQIFEKLDKHKNIITYKVISFDNFRSRLRVHIEFIQDKTNGFIEFYLPKETQNIYYGEDNWYDLKNTEITFEDNLYDSASYIKGQNKWFKDYIK